MSHPSNAALFISAFLRTDSQAGPPRSELHLQAHHSYEGSQHRLVARRSREARPFGITRLQRRYRQPRRPREAQEKSKYVMREVPPGRPASFHSPSTPSRGRPSGSRGSLPIRQWRQARGTSLCLCRTERYGTSPNSDGNSLLGGYSGQFSPLCFINAPHQWRTTTGDPALHQQTFAARISSESLS